MMCGDEYAYSISPLEISTGKAGARKSNNAFESVFILLLNGESQVTPLGVAYAGSI